MPAKPQNYRDDEQPWDGAAGPADARPRESAEPPNNKQLEAAIHKTLERLAQEPWPTSGEQSPRRIIEDVARRHPAARELDDLEIATELVFALGCFALPARVFRRSIARISPDIAAQLMSDPIGSVHLNQAWLAARLAAGMATP